MRPLARRFVGWALIADTIPLYPLYALLFADTGLSDARISALFAIWSGVAVVAEVPSGALADRFSRRGALVAAALLQAVGFAVWTALPGFWGFAAGFVLWGVGGSLVSGSLEALLYDGLADVGAAGEYAKVRGWVTAAGFVAQLPAAAAATLLFRSGGYVLTGWVSVGLCCAAALLATRLPEAARRGSGDADDDLGYLATLRAGVREASLQPLVRRAVIAVAVLTGLDAFEEYVPLAVNAWGVAVADVPAATVAVSLAAAAGSACAGLGNRLRPAVVATLLAAAAATLAAAALAQQALPGVAGLTLFYAVFRLVIVLVDARLQDRLGSDTRATATSVATMATELMTFVVYAAWAAGQVLAVAALVAAAAAALPRWLRRDA